MTNKKELGDDLCKYCPLEKKGVYVVAGGPFAGCEGSRCDEAYENYENLVSQKLEPMTNLEAIVILTRHNAWRRDNETEFPELPDSPVLIGDAIDVAIKALWDLDEAVVLLRTLVDLPFPLPEFDEYKRIEVIEKIYIFLRKLE